MNLATRCTACGTIFRVVQDQLKVSEGWVRCGRCQAVFNAQAGLFDLDRDAPPPWPPETQSPEGVDSTASTSALESTTATVDEEGAGDADEFAAQTPGDGLLSRPIAAFDEPSAAGLDDVAEVESARLAEQVRHDVTRAADEPAMEQADTELRAEPAVEREAATDTPIDAQAEPLPRDEPSADVAATPDFVRQAERDERWERTPVRAMLVLLAVTAALGLALQVTGHFRQQIAAHWPQSTPWLQRFCDVSGCSLDPLRRIDDVSIESTALTQAPGDAGAVGDGAGNALRLAVTLRNRGELPIAMPSVDLSLTGADGELVSRRSLSPTDFQVSDPRLKPGLDAPLSVSFSVTGRRVSGYTVEVFYP